MLFGGGEDDAEEGGGGAHGGVIETASLATGRGGRSAQTFFAEAQIASATPDGIARAKRDLPKGETFMKAPDATATIASASQKPQTVAALEQPSATDVSVQGVAAAQWSAPLPPPRPTEFMAFNGQADAPMPPTRPVEFASLQFDQTNVRL